LADNAPLNEKRLKWHKRKDVSYDVADRMWHRPNRGGHNTTEGGFKA